MTIYVVRHGQTDINLEGKAQGRGGLPLNKNGITQAKELKKHSKKKIFPLIMFILLLRKGLSKQPNFVLEKKIL